MRLLGDETGRPFLPKSEFKPIENRSTINLLSLRIGNKDYNIYLVFGWFPAELDPETRSNVSGPKSGAERSPN